MVASVTRLTVAPSTTTTTRSKVYAKRTASGSLNPVRIHVSATNAFCGHRPLHRSQNRLRSMAPVALHMIRRYVRGKSYTTSAKVHGLLDSLRP